MHFVSVRYKKFMSKLCVSSSTTTSTNALIEMYGTEMTESVGGSNDSKLADPSWSSGNARMELAVGSKKGDSAREWLNRT